MSRVVLLAILGTLVLIGPAGTSAADPALPRLHDEHGIHVEAVRELGARQLDVRVGTGRAGR